MSTCDWLESWTCNRKDLNRLRPKIFPIIIAVFANLEFPASVTSNFSCGSTREIVGDYVEK